MGRVNVYSGVTSDSRKVSEGFLFVAVPGVKVDGASFAREAEMRGAKAVVCEHDIPGLGIPVIRVDDARDYLGRATADFLGNPSASLNVFGITGTNGKTTTSWILREFLAVKSPEKVGLVTTVQTITGVRSFASDHTTPDATSLQTLFAEMVKSSFTDCVMEVSSHSVVQSRISGTRFAGIAFTNLSEDHLDFHGTMEAYYEAKLEFFRRVAKENPGVPAVVFVDGGYGARMAADVAKLPLKLITCSLETKADFTASDIEVSPEGSRFTLSAEGFAFDCGCRLAGRYNVANVLVAAALAHSYGISLDDIVKTIGALEPRWGRLERVSTRSKASVFVDFAHTDDALTNVLSTVRGFTKGRVWAVFGAGGDRDRAKRPLMGAAAEREVDFLVVTSDNPRSEDPDAIIREILKGVRGNDNVHVERDREKAIYYALGEAEAGDSVVVCGKGHETTQTIGDEVIPFDDREVCRAF